MTTTDTKTETKPLVLEPLSPAVAAALNPKTCDEQSQCVAYINEALCNFARRGKTQCTIILSSAELVAPAIEAFERVGWKFTRETNAVTGDTSLRFEVPQ